jgi:ribosomal protein S18 acetylase RimI-like enzyme
MTAFLATGSSAVSQAHLVRAARRADLMAIVDLWVGLVEYHRALDPRLPPPAQGGAAQYAARISDRLRDDSTCILVAEQDGQVIGYVLGMIVDLMSDLFVQGPSGFIADIYVSPDARRSGVGRALVAQLMVWFAARGITYFEWHVASHNQVGQEFWAALGGESVMLRMRSDVAAASPGGEA